jgi:hypothetical protein
MVRRWSIFPWNILDGKNLNVVDTPLLFQWNFVGIDQQHHKLQSPKRWTIAPTSSRRYLLFMGQCLEKTYLKISSSAIHPQNRTERKLFAWLGHAKSFFHPESPVSQEDFFSVDSSSSHLHHDRAQTNTNPESHFMYSRCSTPSKK